MAEYDDFDIEDVYERPPDPQQTSARESLGAFFEEHREQVFFSRQIEVQNEDRYFHWVTNRALRELVDMGDAPSCHVCGAIMTRNGSCYRCMSCGATSGCS